MTNLFQNRKKQNLNAFKITWNKKEKKIKETLKVSFILKRKIEENPIRYASYVYDNETKLYYVKARYYNSELGRFTTRDPIQDNNLYSYAWENPNVFFDDDGLKPRHIPEFGSARGTYRSTSEWNVAKNKTGNTNSLKNKNSVKTKKKNNQPPQLTRGQQFEKDVLKERNLTKNTKKFNNSIPDSLSNGRITEIKDQRYIYNSRQFRDYAKQNKPIDLIVGPKSKVSMPLQRAIKRSGGKIYVRQGNGNYTLY